MVKVVSQAWPGRNANPLKSPVITARQVTAWSRAAPAPGVGASGADAADLSLQRLSPPAPGTRRGDSRGPRGRTAWMGALGTRVLGGGGHPTGLLKAQGPVSRSPHVPRGWPNTHKPPSPSSPWGLSLFHAWARSALIPGGSHQTQGKGCSWLCSTGLVVQGRPSFRHPPKASPPFGQLHRHHPRCIATGSRTYFGQL